MIDTPDWNDDSIDERVRALARSYNPPVGDVPRDAMWKAIAPTLSAARTVDLAPRRTRRAAPFAWAVALAAALVLGVVLEREVLSRRQPSSAGALRGDGRRVATVAPPVAAGGPDAIASATSTAPTGGERAGTPDRVASVPADRRASDRTDVTSRPRSGSADAATDSRLFYRVAARQTLVQAEALLTAYRAGDDRPRDEESLRQAGRWARDVLSSTRLLLDSPAANDPQFRALFTDLELVLAQIVQLSGAPLQADERELIERAMRDRDLLPRLRSALPAGAAAS